MKYHVNDSCIGCGLCTSTCPEVFSMGDDNKAVAAESVPAGAESSAEDAMNGCPVTAIVESGLMEIWLRRVYDRTEKGPGRAGSR